MCAVFFQFCTLQHKKRVRKSLLHCPNSCSSLHFIVPTHSLHYTSLSQLMPFTTLHCPNSCPSLHFIVPTHALHYTSLFQLMSFTTFHCPNSCPSLHFIVPTQALHYTSLSQFMPFTTHYCSNSCTSLHFKTLKSHTKTLKIPPYIFRCPLKPFSGGPWPYFARLLNWKVVLHSL